MKISGRAVIVLPFFVWERGMYLDAEGQPRDPLDSARGIIHGLLLALVLDVFIVLAATAWWLLR
jgi:hypothetical protein